MHEVGFKKRRKKKKKKKKDIAETRDSSELKWALRILNQGPLDLQSNALPTELFRHVTENGYFYYIHTTK